MGNLKDSEREACCASNHVGERLKNKQSSVQNGILNSIEE